MRMLGASHLERTAPNPLELDLQIGLMAYLDHSSQVLG